jgi:SAM-dependent methyltransferase
MEYPDNFARFYDTIYHQLRDGVDNTFFLNEIKQVKGKVLEIGVGTGRFFIEALNRGADIYGIDTSQSMIKVLQGKLAKNLHYRASIQNIIDFRFDSHFDLIIAPFRVMMHVLDKSDQLKAINNVYRHLNEGGKFIFDVFIPDLKQLITGLDNHVDFEGEYTKGGKLKRIVSAKSDLINQLIHVHFRIEWEENEKVMSEEWDLALRFFFRYEIEHLIERTPFTKYHFYGDYNGNELNKESRDFIIVCQK